MRNRPRIIGQTALLLAIVAAASALPSAVAAPGVVAGHPWAGNAPADVVVAGNPWIGSAPADVVVAGYPWVGVAPAGEPGGR
jgi:hypothetical protein